jgi:hypothetical protein
MYTAGLFVSSSRVCGVGKESSSPGITIGSAHDSVDSGIFGILLRNIQHPAPIRLMTIRIARLRPNEAFLMADEGVYDIN